MRGKIVKVWPRNERGPGSVVFETDDGEVKFSTFDEDVLAAARRLDGQRVTYATVQKGQYTNLSSVAAVGAVGAVRGVTQNPARDPVEPPAGFDRLAEAIDRLAAVVARLAGNAPARAQTTVPPVKKSAGAKMPASPLIENSRAERLAARVGEQAAEAMLSALAKKHKTPDAYNAAVVALLAQHDEDLPF